MWRPADNVTEMKSLHNRAFVFRDRAHAGQMLASLLEDFRDSSAIVAGVPAGGVPVAATIATELRLTLNVLVVNKITFPWNAEAGYGAVAADGTYKINEALINQIRLDQTAIKQGIRKTTAKVVRREQQFGKIIGNSQLMGKTVIIIDDGLASGFTMRVAIASARNQQAEKIIVAVPTGHSSAVLDVAQECDHLYCANIREGLRYAVAEAYEHWCDVSEDEVVTVLTQLQTETKHHD